MEAEDDEMIVVIVGDDAEEPNETDTMPKTFIKQEVEEIEPDEVNELLEQAEKHGEHYNLDTLNSIKVEHEEFNFIDERDCFEDDANETDDESLERSNETETILLNEECDIKTEYEEVEFIEEEEDFEDSTVKDYIRLQQNAYWADKDYQPNRRRMLAPSEMKSYVRLLKNENPELRHDPGALVLRLAGVMKALKPPDPPKDYFRLLDCGLLFECIKCGRIFRNETALQRHYQDYHGPRYLVCYACGVDFRSKTNLYKHEKRCDAPDIGCVLRARAISVGAKGRSRPFLHQRVIQKIRKEERSKKPEKQKFHCELCPAAFVTKDGLQAHSNAHRGIRPHRCNKCDAAYTSRSALLRHARTHLDEKFICDHCGKEFNLKHVLVSHMDTHLPLKKHACTYEGCSRRFANKVHLKTHIDSRHNNLPPPCACQVCPRRFARMSMLKVHMKKEHGMIIMTRKMFFQSLPRLSDAQMKQATVLFNSDKEYRLQNQQVIDCDATPNDHVRSRENTKEITPFRENTETTDKGKELQNTEDATNPNITTQILNEDTGEFTDFNSETRQKKRSTNREEHKAGRKKAPNQNQESDVNKYIQRILQKKCREFQRENEGVKAVYLESGEVVQVNKINKLTKGNEKLCSNIKVTPGESMPEL